MARDTIQQTVRNIVDNSGVARGLSFHDIFSPTPVAVCLNHAFGGGFSDEYIATRRATSTVM